MEKASTLCSLLVGGVVAFGGAGIVYPLLASSAQSQSSKAVSADRFELVDNRGIPRARVGLSGGNQQSTFFYMMDSSGRLRFEITVHPGNEIPTVELYDRDGKLVPVSVPQGGVPPPIVLSTSIQNLQSQIDELRLRLEQLE